MKTKYLTLLTQGLLTLIVVDNKIPNASNLLKKTNCNTKCREIQNKITADHGHDKYITTQEFDKLISEKITGGLK